MLKVENVSKTYNGEKVLNKISFTVPEGEIYSLVGAFGEGKTTLINLIAGFDSIDEGNIYVKGTDCKLSPEKARKLFGYVPDVFPSYPNMTLKEYMKFFGRMMDDSDEDKIKHLTVNLLGFVGLSDEIDKRISKLNRNQKQKLSIARALLHNPKLIILDEPFWGLDVEGVREIKEILDFLHGQGRTIFMTSENLQLAASLSTSVGIIENGSMLYGEKTKEAYDNIRNHSVQLQHTGYLDHNEISRQLHGNEYDMDEDISRQLHGSEYDMDEDISRQLHGNEYDMDEDISRQLHNNGYEMDEDISRQMNSNGYEMDEDLSRQLQYTGFIPEEEISRQLHHTGYIPEEEISRQLYHTEYIEEDLSRQLFGEEESEEENEEESLNSLEDLGLDSDLDYMPNFKELEYTSSVHYDDYCDKEQIYGVSQEVTRMPYEQIREIENTRKGEDLSRRILNNSDNHEYDRSNQEQKYEGQSTSSRRGMVEKRGVGGSRVVTDKNNYRKKSK